MSYIVIKHVVFNSFNRNIIIDQIWKKSELKFWNGITFTLDYMSQESDDPTNA